jgi:hypothetical protein
MTPNEATPGAPDEGGAFTFPTATDHPATPHEKVVIATEDPSEDAIDNGIEESFPASDPVSVTVTKAVPGTKKGA